MLSVLCIQLLTLQGNRDISGKVFPAESKGKEKLKTRGVWKNESALDGTKREIFLLV